MRRDRALQLVAARNVLADRFPHLGIEPDPAYRDRVLHRWYSREFHVPLVAGTVLDELPDLMRLHALETYYQKLEDDELLWEVDELLVSDEERVRREEEDDQYLRQIREEARQERDRAVRQISDAADRIERAVDQIGRRPSRAGEVEMPGPRPRPTSPAGLEAVQRALAGGQISFPEQGDPDQD